MPATPDPTLPFLASRPRVATAVILALLAGCGGGATGAAHDERAEKELREIHLEQVPVEAHTGNALGQQPPTLREVIARIDEVVTDEDAAGLFLRLEPLGSGWGRVRDLRDALARVRAAHKPVHCHFEVVDNLAYALAASSCDHITAQPAGDVDLTGIAAHVFHAKRLLDTLGVTADLMHVGRYKDGPDPLMRTDMSPETRESMGALLDDLQSTLVGAIAAGRHLEAAQVQALIDAGPYDAEGARAAGLIDGLAYLDEARAHAKHTAEAQSVEEVSLRDPETQLDLSELVKAFTEPPRAASATRGARLALVVLADEISDGDDESGGPGTSGPFMRELRRLEDDDEVKAVVLRIDSPGGSALASDVMWHAVRRLAAKKPVIASIGDMAASGGYYIASACTLILAHDESIVGSIGVFGGKIVATGLADKVGIDVEILPRGRNASWSSPMAAYSDSERAVVQHMLTATYWRFVRRVALGRNKTQDEIAPWAEGRVWSGARGREHALVDRAGGLHDALAEARSRASLDEDCEIEVWPPRRTLLDTISELLGASSGDSARAWLELEALLSPFPALRSLAPSVGRAVAWVPLLLGGERTLAALPFGLDVR